MTEIYTATCTQEPADTVTAKRQDDRVRLQGNQGGNFRTAALVRPSDARAFARGILSLCDEIDGGEVKPAPVKVGDLVRITAEYSDGTGRCTGKTGPLVEVNLDDTEFPYEVDVPGYGRCGAHSVALVGGTADPLAEPLKVGDRVVIVRNGVGDGDAHVGRVVELRRIDANDDRLPYGVRVDGLSWWCAEVRKADETPTVVTPPAPVKVGDKLRVLVDDANAATVNRGDVLTVTETDTRTFTAIDASGTDWFFNNYNIGNLLEIVTDEPTTLDEPAPIADPRRMALLNEAQRLIDEEGVCVDDAVSLARFLAGE